MSHITKAILLALLAIASIATARAQQNALVVASCGSQSYTSGTPAPITQDLTGKLCSAVGSGPALQNVNLTQLGGNSVATAGGLISSGTLRIVGGALLPVVSSTAESNHVICSGACNLYAGHVTTGGTAGLLMLFNATSAPADGAVTPVACMQVGANSTLGFAYGIDPASFSTGLTVVFSSGTNCFNKTASATAFFSVLAI